MCGRICICVIMAYNYAPQVVHNKAIKVQVAMTLTSIWGMPTQWNQIPHGGHSHLVLICA